jgi:hypothetical protein
MSTTQNTYYNSLDQNQAKSVKGLGTKDRGYDLAIISKPGSAVHCVQD